MTVPVKSIINTALQVASPTALERGVENDTKFM